MQSFRNRQYTCGKKARPADTPMLWQKDSVAFSSTTTKIVRKDFQFSTCLKQHKDSWLISFIMKKRKPLNSPRSAGRQDIAQDSWVFSFRTTPVYKAYVCRLRGVVFPLRNTSSTCLQSYCFLKLPSPNHHQVSHTNKTSKAEKKTRIKCIRGGKSLGFPCFASWSKHEDIHLPNGFICTWYCSKWD